MADDESNSFKMQSKNSRSHKEVMSLPSIKESPAQKKHGFPAIMKTPKIISEDRFDSMSMSTAMQVLISDKQKVAEAKLHQRLETIRRLEQRKYEKELKIAIGKQKGEFMGIPGEERQRLKLFTKHFEVKEEKNIFGESSYQQAMLTNDNFKNIEEYDHILDKVKEDLNETNSNKLDSPILKKDRSAMRLPTNSLKLDKKASELRKSHKVTEGDLDNTDRQVAVKLSKRKSAKLERRMTPHDSPTKKPDFEPTPSFVDIRGISRGQQSMMT